MASESSPAARVPSRAGRVRRDLGQVLVIFTLSIVVFVGLCAVVVDVAWYWANNLQIQRAADAAALAGVVWLPGDASTAVSIARSEATKNGYTSGVNGYTVTPRQDPTNPRRMLVNIQGPVRTYFANLFGLTNFMASRDSKADYVLPVPMGSPANYYGVGYYEKVDPGAASTAGPSLPSSASTTGAYSGFTNRTNAFSFNGSVATGVVATGVTGATQAYGGFGLSVASGSLIDGIDVRIAARSTDPAGCQLGVELSWDAGATWTNTGNRIDVTGSLPGSMASAADVGGSTVTWGRTWTASQLSNANLMVRLRAYDPEATGDAGNNQANLCNNTSTISVDALDVKAWVRAAGTPTEHFITDPDSGVINNPNYFWGAMFTESGNRRNGDYYGPAYVDGTASPTYASGGYDYTVDFTGSTNGEVWLFDPIYCATGSNGHGGWFGAGDHWTDFRSGAGGTQIRPVAVRYRLYDMNGTAYDTGDDILVDTLAYDPANQTYGDFGGEFGTPQNNASADRHDCSADPAHNEWVSLSSGLAGGMYRVNVETTSQTVNQNVGAENLFSIWVHADGGLARVYGGGRMAGYTNINTGGQTFYLAQIERVHAGKTLEIKLFDPGDVSGNAALHILSPDGNSYGDVTFSYQADASCISGRSDVCSATGRTTIQTAIAGSGSSFDNSVITITIPLPSTYGAVGLTPPGETEEGWWKIQYDVAQANDTTTWQVAIRGNPVHLVIP